MRTRATLKLVAGFERKALLVGLALTAVLAAVWLLPAAQSFELKTLDLFFRLKGLIRVCRLNNGGICSRYKKF